MIQYVTDQDCFSFVNSLQDGSVKLFLTDPPYKGIVKESWDNQWKTTQDYVDWMYSLLAAVKPKMADNGSVIFFGGIGKHGDHPFFEVIKKVDDSNLYTYRNMITWMKKRGYGKSHDYLFTREEIVWYSVSPKRTQIVFNKPLSKALRGYPGYNKKYPALSAYKRITNVWTDISELFKTERNTQKPIPLMARFVETHSNPGDLVVDPFCGWGTTGVAALQLGRDFRGCERIAADAILANDRCLIHAPKQSISVPLVTLV